MVEVAQAVVAAIGADRVGIRVSPNVDFNDNAETEAAETYAALLDGLKPLGLAYLHVIDDADADGGVGRALREGFEGTVIVNTGFGGPSDLDTAERSIETSGGDLFSIGRAFIANPDLVDRLRSSAPLNVAGRRHVLRRRRPRATSTTRRWSSAPPEPSYRTQQGPGR